MVSNNQQKIFPLRTPGPLNVNTRRRTNVVIPAPFDITSPSLTTLFSKQLTRKHRCSLKHLSSISLPNQEQTPLIPKYQSIWQRCIFKIKVLNILKSTLKEAKIHKNLPKITFPEVDLLDQSYSNHKNRGTMSVNFSECCEKIELLQKASSIFTNKSETIISESIPFLIIHPKSRFKQNWNIVLMLLLLYTAIGTPFILAFGDNLDQNSVFITDVSVSGLFFLDFYINCSTGYHEKGILITSRLKILLKYLKGWLIIDFISWFPFDFVLGTSGSPSREFARLSRLPKLNRLLRISRLVNLFNGSIHHEILEKFQEALNIKSSKLRLFKVFAAIIICVHIVSCFWYLAAKLYDFSPETWVVKGNYQDSDMFSLYITCMYWAITTLSTCGYGDIVPNTELEICLAIGWMATGLYFFSFTISSLNSMIESYDSKENVLLAKLAAIDEFASENNLKTSLRNKLKHSLRYASEIRGFSWTEKIDLINELPKQLRYEVAASMFQGAARHLKFFYNKDQSIVAFVVPYLDPIFVERDCFVYEENDFADEIYFLVKGNVIISFELKVKLSSVQNGDYFGDVEVMLESSRRFSAFTSRHSDILILNKVVISKIKDIFFGVFCEIMETASKRQSQYERTLIEIKEMEKAFAGNEFSNEQLKKNMPIVKERIEKILKERLKSLEKTPEVTYGTVVKKLNELLEIAASKRLENFNFDNEQFFISYLVFFNPYLSICLLKRFL